MVGYGIIWVTITFLQCIIQKGTLQRILPGPQSNDWYRVSSALSFIGRVHIGARALLDINLVWLYRSALAYPSGEEEPEGGGGGILIVQIISTCLRFVKGGGWSAACGRDPEKLYQLANPLILERHDFDPKKRWYRATCDSDSPIGWHFKLLRSWRKISNSGCCHFNAQRCKLSC